MGLNIPRLVIAGLSGDSGKTIVSLSILYALSQKKHPISVFKKGPDYIDAAWLSKLANNDCYNLDTFLQKPKDIVHSFIINSQNSDLSLIEGNRGLFDGKDVSGTHSTASLAKLLKAPVILVINVTKITRTVAAIVKGCIEFDPEVKIIGVILNKIAGKRHREIITKAIQKYCKIPVLGSIPKIKKKTSLIPDRHLGLVTPSEFGGDNELNKTLFEISSKYIEIEKIIKLAKVHQIYELENEKFVKEEKLIKKSLTRDKIAKKTKIGYFKDSIFTFYYPENLQALEREGASLIEISSLKEKYLPDIDGLYIGGGFPETNAEKLADNTGLLSSVKDMAEKGLPIYAECGGLIFLSRSITYNDKKYTMANIFSVDLAMNKKPVGHGYAVMEVDKENPFYKKGLTIKGHEFHYSSLMPGEEKLESCMKVKTGFGLGHIKENHLSSKESFFSRDGLLYKNVLACYLHIHASGVKVWARNFVQNAIRYNHSKKKIKLDFYK